MLVCGRYSGDLTFERGNYAQGRQVSTVETGKRPEDISHGVTALKGYKE